MTKKDPCIARYKTMKNYLKNNCRFEKPSFHAEVAGGIYEGPWTKTAYVKRNIALLFAGVELHLNKDGTYFLVDSTG